MAEVAAVTVAIAPAAAMVDGFVGQVVEPIDDEAYGRGAMWRVGLNRSSELYDKDAPHARRRHAAAAACQQAQHHHGSAARSPRPRGRGRRRPAAAVGRHCLPVSSFGIDRLGTAADRKQTAAASGFCTVVCV